MFKREKSSSIRIFTNMMRPPKIKKPQEFDTLEASLGLQPCNLFFSSNELGGLDGTLFY